MRVAVTYVHHDSFVLRPGEQALLFGWPAPEHRTPQAEAVARKALTL